MYVRFFCESIWPVYPIAISVQDDDPGTRLWGIVYVLHGKGSLFEAVSGPANGAMRLHTEKKLLLGIISNTTHPICIHTYTYIHTYIYSYIHTFKKPNPNPDYARTIHQLLAIWTWVPYIHTYIHTYNIHTEILISSPTFWNAHHSVPRRESRWERRRWGSHLCSTWGVCATAPAAWSPRGWTGACGPGSTAHAN